MKLAMSKTREQFPLSYKKIIKKTLASTIGLAILFIILCFFTLPLWIALQKGGGFINFIFGVGALLSLIFLAILILIAYLYQRWYFAVYFYDLNNDFIVIRKGPITPREITIPYERVQDIYVDQDIFDRIFGLYDVHLSSATISSGMEAHIDGVEKTAAEGLRNLLLQTVQQKIGRKNSQNIPQNNPAN